MFVETDSLIAVIGQTTPVSASSGILGQRIDPTFPDFGFNFVQDNGNAVLTYTALNYPDQKIYPSLYVRPFGALRDTVLQFDSVSQGMYSCRVYNSVFPYGFQASSFVVDTFSNSFRDSIKVIPTIRHTWNFESNRWYIINPQTQTKFWTDFVSSFSSSRISGTDYLISIYRNGNFIDFDASNSQTFYSLKPTEPFLIYFKNAPTFNDSLIPVIQDSGLKAISQTLSAGWNLVANPFHFPISLSNVSCTDSISPFFAIADSSNSQKTYYSIHSKLIVDSLKPFIGYFVFSTRSGAILTYNPYRLPMAKAAQSTPKLLLSITNPYHNIIVGAGERGYEISAPPMGALSLHSNNKCVNIIESSNLAVIPLTLQSGLKYSFKKESSDEKTIFFNLYTGDTIALESSTEFAINATSSSVSGFIISGDAFAVFAYIEKKISSYPRTAYASTPSPNPFNPTTTIRYGVPFNSGRDGYFVVYNSRGQQVSKLALPSVEPGHYMLTWNAKDGMGNSVSSGTYIGQILFANKNYNFKMVVQK